MDTWAAAAGAGAVRAGLGYDVAGTSEAVGLVTARRAEAPGLVTLRWTEAAFQLGGPTQAGADSAAWCHDVFRVAGSLGEAIARAGGRVPAPDLPLLLPYLAGERAPVWRSDVRGSFVGVARGHDADAFLWATLEGVAHAVHDILDIACVAAGESLAELRVAGGGARADAWCQLKADVLGVPVARTSQDETGVIGAAMAAAVGLGAHHDLAAAAGAMARVGAVFEPTPALRDLFAERAALYRAIKAHALALADRRTMPAPAGGRP
jgi:xylulokinase